MEIKFKPIIGADLARSILDRALECARSEDFAVSIAVVDEGGYPLAIQRMDGAGLLTWQVARDKARTAALIRAPTRVLSDRLRDEPALLRLTEYLPMTGGLPIGLEGQCAVGIGVSGGTAEQDERVAAAGLKVLDGQS